MKRYSRRILADVLRRDGPMTHQELHTLLSDPATHLLRCTLDWGNRTEVCRLDDVHTLRRIGVLAGLDEPSILIAPAQARSLCILLGVA